jgi:HEAT repeat protein
MGRCLRSECSNEGRVLMRSLRFSICLTVFLFAIMFTGSAAYCGTSDLLLARLHYYDPDIQIEKLDRPAGVRDRALVRALSSVATDINEDWHVRISAIRILGDTGDPGATDALMAALLDFCPAIRWNAANALGGFSDDPRVVVSLLEALHSDTLYIQEAAIRSLGKIGSREAVPPLIERLDSQSFAIRSSAIISLGEIKDADAIPYLKAIAERDTDAFLRSEALSAIGKIEGKKKSS